MTIFWAEKSFADIAELTKRHEIAILPIGSTEQHGPHLPTGTDHIIAWELCKKVAEEVDALLLPLLPFGFSHDHFPKPGTISVEADTLKRIIWDTAISLHKSGVKHIIIISGHAGHLHNLNAVCYELNVTGAIGETRTHMLCPYTSITMEELATVLEEDMFIHAEELETSLLLYLHPEWVDMKRAVKEHPDYIPKGLTTEKFLEAVRIVTTTKFLGTHFETGVCGDATLATKEKGEKLFKMLSDVLITSVKRVTSA